MQQPDDQIAPRIIAIANQKGGVGKTTTAVNLGAAFAAAGLSVLIIDLDPQGNASTALGIAMEDRVRSMTEVILGECSLQDAIRPTEMKGLRIVPATTDLASMGLHLAQQRGRLRIVRNAIRTEGPQNEARADVILIDCPPSLNLLTLNALAAADSVLVPLQSEFFALEGLSQLLLTVRELRQASNPDLRIEGIVLTMIDPRNRLAREVEKDVRGTLGSLVCETTIPRNVRVSEAQSHGKPILSYDRLSKATLAYQALAQELLGRLRAPHAEGTA
ncbi:MAG: ParA family protein [Gemmobacter sp.]|jgi:chromosome partitioning protein